MFDNLCGIITLVAAATGLRVVLKTKEALHPAVFLAPLLGFFYGIGPILLNWDGDLLNFFDRDQLDYVGELYAITVVSFCLGLGTLPAGVRGRFAQGREIAASPIGRIGSAGSAQKLRQGSVILGIISVAAYWWGIQNAGGFVAAYSVAKGGGWSDSGYIGEAPLLSFPALGLLALSRQGRRIRLTDIVLAFAVLSPHLLQGTFGGRRGPLFLGASALFVAWYLAKGVRPRLTTLVLGVSLITVLVATVASQRKDIYLGSDGNFEVSRLIDSIRPETVGPDNDYLVGIASVLTADHFGSFYWGYRYFVTFVIRPIPKQIWPTKYEDMGADWALGLGDDERNERFLQAVGLVPESGTAIGFVADLYNEVGWGTPLVAYLLGRGLAALWARHVLRGGLWTIVFLESLILGIYIPTQSLSAFMHRFLLMAGSTALAWRIWIRPEAVSPRSPATAPRVRAG